MKVTNYTQVSCQAVASMYSTLKQFRECAPVAYKESQKNKWYIKFGNAIEWSEEICQIVASIYTTENEFKTNMPLAYEAAQTNNWSLTYSGLTYLGLINSLVPSSSLISTNKIKPHGYWSLEQCRAEARKYALQIEFHKKSSSAYNASRNNGWLEEITKHMEVPKKPNGYWSKERCHAEALKYATRSDFNKSAKASYTASVKNKWVDEICSHMTQVIKPINYWDRERCAEAAAFYKTKYDFRVNNRVAYVQALKNGWNEIFSHMPMNERTVYTYEFSDNHVYVGLTHDIGRRDEQHRTSVSSIVYKHIKDTGLEPELKLVVEGINVKDAAELELKTIQDYKVRGYKVLNKVMKR